MKRRDFVKMLGISSAAVVGGIITTADSQKYLEVPTELQDIIDWCDEKNLIYNYCCSHGYRTGEGIIREVGEFHMMVHETPLKELPLFDTNGNKIKSLAKEVYRIHKEFPIPGDDLWDYLMKDVDFRAIHCRFNKYYNEFVNV